MLDRVVQFGTSVRGVGAGNMSGLTRFQNAPGYHESPSDEFNDAEAESHPASGGNPLTFLFILLGLIVTMFFVHRASPLIREEAFGVNWVTFLQVGVMSSFFILLAKAFFGRYHIRGITNAVQAL